MKHSELIEVIAKQTGKTPKQKDLADILDKPLNTISARSSKDLKYSYEEIQKIGKYYGVDFFQQQANNEIVDKIMEISKKGIGLSKKPLQNVTSDCIALPIRGNVSASMGNGLEVYDESQTETYFVSLQFLKELGANKDKTELIFAYGDSMEPTIHGGDRLFVDLSKKEIYDGKIYCIRYEGNLYAKRLQKIPTSTVVVISDNPKYESWKIDFSKELEFDFEIIGEILYWGRVAR